MSRDIRGVQGFPPVNTPRARPGVLSYGIYNNPAFQPAAPSPAALPHAVQGRLSIYQSNPTEDNAGVGGVIYFTPYNGEIIRINTGKSWEYKTFKQAAVSVPDTINQVYDVYGRYNGGRLILELVAWNAPATGAITSISNANPRVVTVASHSLAVGDLVYIRGNTNGVNNTLWRVSAKTGTTFTIVNLNATNPGLPGSVGTGGTWTKALSTSTRVFNPVQFGNIWVHPYAKTWLLLGIARTGTGTPGAVNDSPLSRDLVNLYNPIRRRMEYIGDTFPYSHNATTARVWRNDLQARLEFLSSGFHVTEIQGFSIIEDLSATGGLAVDGTSETTSVPSSIASGATADIRATSIQYQEETFSAGFHWVYGMERAATAGTYFVRMNWLRANVRG